MKKSMAIILSLLMFGLIGGLWWYRTHRIPVETGNGTTKSIVGPDGTLIELDILDTEEEISAFIKSDWSIGGIQYWQVQTHFKDDQLPLLYEMLKDEEYQEFAPNIACVIGMLSHDVNSVPILIDCFERREKENITEELMTRKIFNLSFLGKVGSEQSEEVLKKALQTSGALELAEQWIDSEPVTRLYGNKEKVVLFIQRAAILGLVFLQKEETDAIVSQAYSLELSKSTTWKDRTPLCSSLSGAMAIKDYIKEYDLETYLRNPKYVPSQYLQKYSPWLREQRIKNKQILERLRQKDTNER